MWCRVGDNAKDLLSWSEGSASQQHNTHQVFLGPQAVIGDDEQRTSGRLDSLAEGERKQQALKGRAKGKGEGRGPVPWQRALGRTWQDSTECSFTPLGFLS